MRVRGSWKGVKEQSILGGLIFRTQRRADDLQVIGKVSSRVDNRIYLVCEVTGMSSLRTYIHTTASTSPAFWLTFSLFFWCIMPAPPLFSPPLQSTLPQHFSHPLRPISATSRPTTAQKTPLSSTALCSPFPPLLHAPFTPTLPSTFHKFLHSRNPSSPSLTYLSHTSAIPIPT